MISTAGIDLGNSNCVVAVPKDASVKVVLNQSSNRLTPTMVCYSNERRYAGELASQNQMQYQQCTITDLKKLVDLPYDSYERQEISQFQNLVKLNDGTVGLKVLYQDKEIILRPEQCIGFLLRDISTYPEIKGIENFVITVNPWWSERQRRTLLTTFRIAQLKCSCLLNAPTAAAIAYILQHRQRLPTPDKKSVHVAFVDIGSSAMTVAIAELKQQNVCMKAITYNEEVNGGKLTDLFENYLLKIVKKKYKIDPSSNPRSMLRFHQAVEKAKKVLSINPVYQFEVHSLMNVDISFPVKREEFNDQIQCINGLLEAPINEALTIANVDKNDIFELQLLGGTTRVVTIKNELTRIFGREPKQSMDLDECFAIGCAFMGAYLSPRMRVPFVVKDITPHAFVARWQGNNDGCVVFPRFNRIPSIKTIKIPVRRKAKIDLFDDGGNCVAHIKVRTGTNEEATVAVRFRLTQSCIIEVIDGVFDLGGKTEAATITTKYEGELDEETIQKMVELEQKMQKNDAEEMRIDIARNDLEGQIYILNDLIEKNFFNFVKIEKRDDVRRKINDIQLWFEDKEFDRMPPNEYKVRADELRRIVSPVKERIDKYESSVGHVLSLKNRAVELLHSVEADVKHQTDTRRDKLMNDIMKFLKKMNSIKEEMMNGDVAFDEEKENKKLEKLTKEFEDLSKK